MKYSVEELDKNVDEFIEKINTIQDLLKALDLLNKDYQKIKEELSELHLEKKKFLDLENELNSQLEVIQKSIDKNIEARTEAILTKNNELKDEMLTSIDDSNKIFQNTTNIGFEKINEELNKTKEENNLRYSEIDKKLLALKDELSKSILDLNEMFQNTTNTGFEKMNEELNKTKEENNLKYINFDKKLLKLINNGSKTNTVLYVGVSVIFINFILAILILLFN